ncbi:hypothetical protein JCM9957A_23850 [Kineosporia succinea]
MIRRALNESALNIVGENHQESDGLDVKTETRRREVEQRYLKKFHFSKKNYWGEKEFKFEFLDTKLHGDDSRAHIASAIRKTAVHCATTLDFLEETKKASNRRSPLSAASVRTLWDMIHSGLAGIKKELRQVYLAELVHAPIRHKIESLRQAGVTFPLIMKVMDPFREKYPWTVEATLKLDPLRVMLDSAFTEYAGAVGAIFSAPEKSRRKPSKDGQERYLMPHLGSADKFLEMRALVAEIGDIVTPLKDKFDMKEAIQLRSMIMANQAMVARILTPETTGVWKVGDTHVGDMKRFGLEDRLLAQNITLTTLKEFNEAVKAFSDELGTDSTLPAINNSRAHNKNLSSSLDARQGHAKRQRRT